MVGGARNLAGAVLLAAGVLGAGRGTGIRVLSATAAFSVLLGTVCVAGAASGGSLRGLGRVHSSYAKAALADSPVAFWRLGGARGQSVVDSSGNGNAGFSVKVGVSSRPLVRGSTTSASFDGRASRMLFRPSRSLESGARLSMEAWVDARTVPSAPKSGWALVSEFNRAMLAMGGGGGGPKFSFALLDKATGTWMGVTSSTTIVPGRIYHVVGSYDGSKLRIYVNGALEATTEHTGQLAQIDASGGGLATNGWGRRPSSTFAGLLDNVAIYRKALSVVRVKLHYLQGRIS